MAAKVEHRQEIEALRKQVASLSSSHQLLVATQHAAQSLETEVAHLKRELAVRASEATALRAMLDVAQDARKRSEQRQEKVKPPSTHAASSSTRLNELLRTQLLAAQKENAHLTQLMALKDHDINVHSNNLRQARERLRQVHGELDDIRRATLSSVDVQVKAAPPITDRPSLQRSSEMEKGWILYTTPMAHDDDDGNDTSALYRELNKLPPPVRSQLLKMIEPIVGGAHVNIDEVLPNLPPEALDGLLVSLMPVLSRHGRQVQVYTRMRRSIVTDARIVSEHDDEHERRSTAASLHDILPSPRERISSQSKPNPYGADHLFSLHDSGDASIAVLHGPRELHPTKPYFVSRALQAPPTPPMNRVSGGSTSAMMNHPTSPYVVSGEPSPDAAHHPTRFNSLSSKAKKLMGLSSRSSTPQRTPTRFVHEKATCDGCQRSPIVGPKWVCRSCAHVELCDKCYAYGVHGHDHDEELFDRVLQRMLSQYPRLEPEDELLDLLRHDICKMSLKKFSFCLTWIGHLLDGKTSADLRARALEITKLQADVGNRFVTLLTRLMQLRKDIQVASEWIPDEAAPHEMVLRLWIVDTPSN
ncbi:hypothetical protein SPRG_08787 [Saprolegnia parasitica CBS 223.65]|uniref:ZZ-type domain-containing protein n=1 Tax=Saprolegnia parasitica (strain CBS 223.65) TaxID=695850 RepID=A0A067C5Q5_SAPPC|nr:hypothetical protein SPRG_08787 [Saprolegnia parasitica CBS 223.65]KDO25843.1 hypothetical protein SPRG_08787 [Saprolegnia parasitica CBS 223.65]|eukprot:XP_012203407.1 hypothetical protein SPRG_08787 [Saprolegnia parasitica CBS 223.65]